MNYLKRHSLLDIQYISGKPDKSYWNKDDGWEKAIELFFLPSHHQTYSCSLSLLLYWNNIHIVIRMLDCFWKGSLSSGQKITGCKYLKTLKLSHVLSLPPPPTSEKFGLIPILMQFADYLKGNTIIIFIFVARLSSLFQCPLTNL